MSSITDKKLCIVSRQVSNFYNLDGCSQFQCPKGTVLCGLSFDFDHPEFQQFEYGALAVKDCDCKDAKDNSDKGKDNEASVGSKATEETKYGTSNKTEDTSNTENTFLTGDTDTAETSTIDTTPTDTVSFGPVEWSDMIEDAEVGYDLPQGRFIVGMKVYIRSGKISFKVATSEVSVDGEPVYFSDRMISPPILVQDVQNWFVANENCVISGIHVYSTKEMQTGYFCYSALSLTVPKRSEDIPFDIIVGMHPTEKYFPLNATDYLRVCRLRKRHNSSPEPDPCYDTHSRQFVPEDMHLPTFYNISPSVINSFHSYEPARRLFNLRPHDQMSLKSNEVYLQPMVKLRGVHTPNGRTPVYTRILRYNLIGIHDVTYYDFWMFFGYHYDVRNGISFSHQGDWSHVMVKTSGGRIIAAWLSQHDRLSFYRAEDLEIVEHFVDEDKDNDKDNDNTSKGNDNVFGDDNVDVEDNVLEDDKDVVEDEDNEKETVGSQHLVKRQQLKIYCAGGSHALYPTTGSHSLKGGLSHDHTQNGGYQWKITDFTADLESQPWKDFAGAWGEVGEFTHSTGPLGPWYKRFDFWYQDKVSLKDIIKDGDIIIVSDNTLLTTPFEESRDHLNESPKNTVLVGLKHCGDENGTTRCVYSTLKAIDRDGNVVEGKIELKDVHWDEWFQESNSLYNAPVGYVILDRQHVGDENGNSRFKIGSITFNGQPTAVTPADAFIVNQVYIESKGVFFRTNPFFLMIGAEHNGDENGDTVNFQGLVNVSLPQAKMDKVDDKVDDSVDSVDVSRDDILGNQE